MCAHEGIGGSKLDSCEEETDDVTNDIAPARFTPSYAGLVKLDKGFGVRRKLANGYTTVSVAA